MTMGRTAFELELEVADVFPAAAREKASLSLSLAERMLVMVGPEEESVDLPDWMAVMLKEAEDDDIGLVFFSVKQHFYSFNARHVRTCVGDNACVKLCVQGDKEIRTCPAAAHACLSTVRPVKRA